MHSACMPVSNDVSGDTQMHEFWQVNDGLVAPADRPVFASMASLLSAPMTRVTRDTRSAVSRLALADTYYDAVYKQ